MRKLLTSISILLLGLCVSIPGYTQSGGSLQAITPLTRDIGAVRILTAQATGTVNSADQNGFNVSRVVCVYNQTAISSAGAGVSPSTTFKIQNKDAASGLYYDLITSAATTTALNTPSAISAGGGVATTTNVGAGVPIAQKWRVSVIVGGGATATVTGTVGCSLQ